MKPKTGDINFASPRPWRVEHVTRSCVAYVKAANDEVVTICHADNAKMITRAVNVYEQIVGKAVAE